MIKNPIPWPDGASVGSLTVDGDFTPIGGTLKIEIGTGGDTDQLIVTNLLDVRDEHPL